MFFLFVLAFPACFRTTLPCIVTWPQCTAGTCQCSFIWLYDSFSYERRFFIRLTQAIYSTCDSFLNTFAKTAFHMTVFFVEWNQALYCTSHASVFLISTSLELVFSFPLPYPFLWEHRSHTDHSHHNACRQLKTGSCLVIFDVVSCIVHVLIRHQHNHFKCPAISISCILSWFPFFAWEDDTGILYCVTVWNADSWCHWG